MKKIGIVLAALVIATFMVGTAAAVSQIKQPTRDRCYFTEESSVQGTGVFAITKNIVDRNIAIDVEESITGNTGPGGTFEMQSLEKLNESVNVNDPDDPDYTHKKMIDFQADITDPTAGMKGFEKYGSSTFTGGTGASVKEIFDVTEMQKQETTSIKTTSAVTQKQSLNFDVQNMFTGTWGTQAEWKKICSTGILHEQVFTGNFQVTKNLIFEEDVI